LTLSITYSIMGEDFTMGDERMLIKLFEKSCIKCRALSDIVADPDDFADWAKGKLIQDAMPYMSDSDRELLISSICGPCFDVMFGEGEDDEYGDDDLTL